MLCLAFSKDGAVHYGQISTLVSSFQKALFQKPCGLLTCIFANPSRAANDDQLVKWIWLAATYTLNSCESWFYICMKDVSSLEWRDEVFLNGDRNKVAFLFVLIAVFYWMWFLVFAVFVKTKQKLSIIPLSCYHWCCHHQWCLQKLFSRDKKHPKNSAVLRCCNSESNWKL